MRRNRFRWCWWGLVWAVLAGALAEAGINLRGLSAAAIGKRYVAQLALDTAQDVAKAAAVLKKLY